MNKFDLLIELLSAPRTSGDNFKITDILIDKNITNESLRCEFYQKIFNILRENENTKLVINEDKTRYLIYDQYGNFLFGFDTAISFEKKEQEDKCLFSYELYYSEEDNITLKEKLKKIDIKYEYNNILAIYTNYEAIFLNDVVGRKHNKLSSPGWR